MKTLLLKKLDKWEEEESIVGEAEKNLAEDYELYTKEQKQKTQ